MWMRFVIYAIIKYIIKIREAANLENNQLNRMEEMMGTLIKMVGENNSKLKTLEEGMQEVKGSVKELMQAQERQDRILEMLSVKSIETDSYIRDFKRKM
jgi:hypothetical protein